MTRCLLVLATAASFSAPALAQSTSDAQSAPSESVSRLSAALRAEASKPLPVESRRLFADLTDPKVANDLGLSGEQRELAGRLDDLTRELIGAWLRRDLQAVPLPRAAVLAERLSERGVRLRARLVAHAESIALEGILDPGQARRWRHTAGRRAQPLLTGPSARPPLTVVAEDARSDELAAELRAMAPRAQTRAGSVFVELLGAGGASPPVMLPKEEKALVSRLDALTVAIIRVWITRGLDGKTLPRSSVLAERVAWSAAVRASIEAHAEAIVLEGILTAEQAEQSLTFMWRLWGLSALSDPRLAFRLRLSQAQRDELRLALENKGTFLNDGRSEVLHAIAAVESMPGGKALGERMAQEFKDRAGELDAAIWNVLRPNQARELERIFGQAKPSPHLPAKRNRSTGALTRAVLAHTFAAVTGHGTAACDTGPSRCGWDATIAALAIDARAPYLSVVVVAVVAGLGLTDAVVGSRSTGVPSTDGFVPACLCYVAMRFTVELVPQARFVAETAVASQSHTSTASVVPQGIWALLASAARRS